MRHRAFTLVELLVVITIIAMLMGLLIPAVQRARESGKRITCLNNMKNVGGAMIQFATSKDYLPGYVTQRAFLGTGNFVGYVPQLLPYLERNDIYSNYQGTGNLFSVGATSASRIEVLACPSDTNLTLAAFPDVLSYFPNAGMADVDNNSAVPLDWADNGVSFNQAYKGQSGNKPAIKLSLSDLTRKDGASRTIMLGENVSAAPFSSTVDVTGHWALTWAPAGNWDLETWRCGLTWLAYATPTAPTLGMNKQITSAGTMTATDAQSFWFTRPASAHPGGFHLMMCGGEGKFFSEDMAYTIYAALMASSNADAKVAGSTNTPPTSIGLPWTAIPLTDADLQ